MKLELKHLAGYLPYELQSYYNLSDVININKKDEVRSKLLTSENVDFVLKYCKPILRPLSDLTKELEVNGKKFVPLVKLWEMDANQSFNKDFSFDFKQSYRYTLEKEWTLLIDNKPNFHFSQYSNGLKSFRYANGSEMVCLNNFGLFNKLYEWHFDIHGLIEKELAIDINTISP